MGLILNDADRGPDCIAERCRYPKNSNVAAMLALGSRVGLDNTSVVLLATPHCDDVSIEVGFPLKVPRFTIVNEEFLN